MALTPDQWHCFQRANTWREFRSAFSSPEAALDAYAAASQECAGSPAKATHVLKWRRIFHNRESNRRQILALPLLLLGHFQTAHAEFHFETLHCLSVADARRLVLGRVLGACIYHLCFVGMIAAGVGLLVAVVTQAFSGVTLNLFLLSVGLLVLFFWLFVIAGRSRSMGLFGPARVIAKDAFDLVSIRRVKTPVIAAAAKIGAL